MKAKLVGMSAFQGVPTRGTLSVYPTDRYEDGNGNATVGRQDYVLDVATRTWRDAHNPAADAYLVVAAPGEPEPVGAMFEEVIEYAGRGPVRTIFRRHLVASNLNATEYSYIEPQNVVAYSEREPLTMQAARETVAMKPALDQALVDTAQSAAEALATTGINPAYISETEADPPAAPDGTKGAKRDEYGNLTRLLREGGAWRSLGKRLITYDALPEIAAEYYGVRASASDNGAALQDAITDSQTSTQFAGSTLLLKSGTYTYGTTLEQYGSLSFKAASPLGARLNYQGTDYMMIVNSRAVDVGPGYVGGQVTSLDFDGLAFAAPNGKGILLGSTINKHVAFRNGYFRQIPQGYAINGGRSSYFVTLHKVGFVSTGGVRVRPESDLWTLDQCWFGNSVGYDATIETVAYTVINSSFEGSSGRLINPDAADLPIGRAANLGNLLLLVSDLAAGYGHLIGNRFGSETGGGQTASDGTVAPYDIVVSNSGRAAKTYNGLRVIGGTHFSKTGSNPAGSMQKRAPIYLDAGIGNLDVRGLSVANQYASPYHIERNAANIAPTAASDPSGNVVDNLARVEPVMRGFFREAVRQKAKTEQAIAIATLPQHVVCYVLDHDMPSDTPKLQRVNSGALVELATHVLGSYSTRQADGSYATATGGAANTYAGGTRLQAHVSGSQLDTTLDASASAVGAPVYATSGTGALTLTPQTGGYARVIGRVLKAVANAPIQLTFEPSPASGPLPGAVPATAAGPSAVTTMTAVAYSGEQSGAAGQGRVQTANTAELINRCCGVVVGAYAANDTVQVRGVGAVATTTLDATGYATDAPLYARTSDGSLTFDAALTAYPRVIARLVSAGGADTTATVRVTLEEMASRAMPASGTWQAGQTVAAYLPAEQGAAGGKYRVVRWRRLTSGSGHVLGTDWAEDRVLTGG